MIDNRIKAAIEAALTAFSAYNQLNTTQLITEFEKVFSAEEDFLTKVDALDAVFDDNPVIEELREVFFDLLMINFFSADVKRLDDDYLETPEWEAIEEETLDRGTELLNLLLYLNECDDEDIEPELDDYLKEFLLVDEDEFQDEYNIYEPVIANQVLMDSTAGEIAKVAEGLPEDSELKDLFYPMMCFFQNTYPTDKAKQTIAEYAVNAAFDIAILEILYTFN